MAYRIEYGAGSRISIGRTSLRFLTILAIFLSLFSAGCIFTNGQGLLWQIVFPGGDAVTQTAVRQMVTDLQEGTSVVSALTVFCETVLEYAPE